MYKKRKWTLNIFMAVLFIMFFGWRCIIQCWWNIVIVTCRVIICIIQWNYNIIRGINACCRIIIYCIYRWMCSLICWFLLYFVKIDKSLDCICCYNLMLFVNIKKYNVQYLIRTIRMCFYFIIWTHGVIFQILNLVIVLLYWIMHNK